MTLRLLFEKKKSNCIRLNIYLVSSIDFTKYTHIHYAFAIMTEGNTPQWTDQSNTDSQLAELVSAAHKSSAKVLISVGGWSGSITFR